MQNQVSPQLQSPVNQPLFVWDNPGKIFDRNGRPVDTTGEIWRLQEPSNNIDLNWDTLDAAPDIKDAIKAYLAYTIESQSPITANQVFTQLKYCLVRLPAFNSAAEITYEILESGIARLRHERKDWHFHYIRKWYQWCEDQGVPGFRGEIASRLYRLRILINPRGEKVMTRDVNDGPVSHDEHFLIRQAVKEGRGLLVSRVIIMLLLELGARPIQLVNLEERDFNLQVGPTGQPFYSLNVPRAKQRTVGERETKRRRISPELGRLIERLIEQNHIKYNDRGSRMPLLCVRNTRLKKLTEELRERYEMHMKVVGFGQRVRGFATAANIVSPRTGKVIKLHARRLRYTYFTLLAEQGASTNHLAELADHSNDKSIIIYVASTSRAVERLNAALGKDKHYASTLNRFQGVVIQQTGTEDPATVIRGSTPTFKDLGGIGLCGANFLCNLYPPLSCYVCPKFQAWTDGPHERLQLEIENYVLQLTERSSNPSDRIPYQLVDVLASIRQLLNRIEELKNGNTGTGA